MTRYSMPRPRSASLWIILFAAVIAPRQVRGDQPLPTLQVPAFSVSVFALNVSAVNAIALDNGGSLLVSEFDVGDIKRIAPDGTQSVLASGIPFPTGIAVRPDGAVFVTSSTSSNSNLLSISATGAVSIFSCCFSFPAALASDSAGNLYVANSGSGSISRVAPDGSITQVVSGFSQSGGPSGIAFDPQGALYFTEHATGKIYRKSVSGPVELLLSGLTPFGPTYLALDSAGSLYVSNSGDGTITRRKANGAVETFATGFLGNGTPPVIGPMGIIFESSHAMLVANGDEILRISGPFADSPPTAVLQVPAVIECDSSAGAHVVLDAGGSSDPDGEALVYSFVTPSESVVDQVSPSFSVILPFGESEVTLTVRNSSGNMASVSTVVAVVDTQPPVIMASLVPVPSSNSSSLVATFSAADVCDPRPIVSGLLGSGVASGEAVTLQENSQIGVLRLESPAFRLLVTAKDASGNSSTKTVDAPH